MILKYVQFDFSILGQTPVAKVGIITSGRSLSGVNKPNYTSWFVPSVQKDSIIVSGVAFLLRATALKPISAFLSLWSKTLVQNSYFMCSVNVGVKIENDTLLKYPH